MRKRLTPALAAVALVAGCGAVGADVATNPDPEPASTSDPTSHPTSHPTGAPWPKYQAQDYTFMLRVSCYCPDAGIPVTVTVRDGDITDAVYARKGWGHAAGAPAPGWMRVTINDVIDAANDTHADTVTVRWPDGQDYPTSVWVDRDRHAADEEIGYTIRNVEPSS
jgi:hypothetical protein